MGYRDIFTQLRETLITDKNIYNAFAFSIKSVLDETDFQNTDSYELARHIADRIIGVD